VREASASVALALGAPLAPRTQRNAPQTRAKPAASDSVSVNPWRAKMTQIRVAIQQARVLPRITPRPNK
jgi:hypothetical protein